MEPNSKPVGGILKTFLLASIVLSAVDMIGALLHSNGKTLGHSGAFPSLSNVEMTYGAISLIVWLTTGIFFLIWFFKVHDDLRRITYGDYRITPGGAMARMLIPIYSIYGSWHVFWVMGNYFKAGNRTFTLGKNLLVMMPFYYLLTWGTNIFDQLYPRQYMTDQVLFIVLLFLELLLNVVYYLMTKMIIKAVEREWEDI